MIATRLYLKNPSEKHWPWLAASTVDCFPSKMFNNRFKSSFHVQLVTYQSSVFLFQYSTFSNLCLSSKRSRLSCGGLHHRSRSFHRSPLLSHKLSTSDLGVGCEKHHKSWARNLGTLFWCESGWIHSLNREKTFSAFHDVFSYETFTLAARQPGSNALWTTTPAECTKAATTAER